MNSTKYFLIILIGCVVCETSFSQGPRKLVLDQLHELQKTFNSSNGLSFDMKYTYANESKPSIILDSLNGEVLLYNNNYKLKINRTETIRNDKYTIMLFEDDNLMHISASKPPVDALDPSAIIDSSVLNDSSAAYFIKTENNIIRINISFSSGQPYKRVSFLIDGKTGWLIKSILVVKTEFMAASVSDDLKDYDDYAIIETVYSNYRVSKDKREELEEKKYFTKVGKEFLPTDRYKNYKIFIGTPNL